MPGMNGTGPMGLGPMTGGGRGLCAVPMPMGSPAYGYPGAFRGVGRGGIPWGGGRGRTWGGGRGRGWRTRAWPASSAAYGYAPPSYPGVPPVSLSVEEEIKSMQAQAEFLKEQLSAIESRITEMEAQEKKED